MDYKSRLSEVKNVSAVASIHDKNDLLFKNRLNKEFDLPQRNGRSFKEELNKKKEEKDSISIDYNKTCEQIDNDSIDIDFLDTIRNNQKSMEEQYIACKIACGEYTSAQEIEFLKEKNCDLLKRAVVIGKQRKNLEMKLKIVKNKHEAQVLIFRAKSMIEKMCISYDNKAFDGGTIKVIMQCSINKAEKKYLNNNLYDDNLQLQINLLEAGIE